MGAGLGRAGVPDIFLPKPRSGVPFFSVFDGCLNRVRSGEAVRKVEVFLGLGFIGETDICGWAISTSNFITGRTTY